MRCVDLRRVEGGVEPKDSNMQDPDTIEVNQKMQDGTFFKVRLEEDAVPIDAAKLHKALGRRYVDEASL
jgi:hypothetical protein